MGALPGMNAGMTQKTVKAVEVVFVVDTTGSMGPYIESVRQGIQSAASFLQDQVKAGEDRSISFGFVGFQDQFDDLDYVTKDFTSDGLVDADTFVALVDAQVKAEDWGDHLIPERLFEGYEAGVNAQWSDDALKFIVVITDAPGIPQSDGKTQNATEIGDDYVLMSEEDPEAFEKLAAVSVGDAERNGKLAADANIITFVHHIRSGRFPELDNLATDQLTALVQNEGSDEGYYEVDGAGGSSDSYDEVIKATASAMSVALGITVDTMDDAVDEAEAEIIADESSDADVSDVVSMTVKAVKAAAMDYLGDTESIECDYRGWTTDRDLADNAVRALEVNTLLTNHELDTLHLTLKDIHSALATGAVTGAGFIDSLQSVGTVVLANPDAIEASKSGSLASSGLLPRWLESLPYQSTISTLSGDDINALTSAERTQLELNVAQKIQYYEAMMQDNERWFALSDRDEENPKKKVTPLPVEELP